MPIELNAIETRRFGCSCAKVIIPDATIAEIDAAAIKQNVKMLTIRVDTAQLALVHDLEAAGFRLMDTLVYYQRDVIDIPEPKRVTTSLKLRLAEQQDAPEVGKIASLAFVGYTGHYHADPRLSKADADAAYIEWAEKSTWHTSINTPVFVAETEFGIVGFLTMRRNSDEQLEAVLSAVDPHSKGQGIYQRLIREGLHLALELNCRHVITSTQINNYAVQRVWATLNFTHFKSIYTFHKWY